MTQSLEAINGVIHTSGTGSDVERFIHAADLLRIMRDTSRLIERSVYSYLNGDTFVEVFLKHSYPAANLTVVYSRCFEIDEASDSLRLLSSHEEDGQVWHIETIEGRHVDIKDESGEVVYSDEFFSEIDNLEQEFGHLMRIEDAIPLIQSEAEQDCALPYKNQ